jgi:hypothetical protein
MGVRRSYCNRCGGYRLFALAIIVFSILAGSIAFAQDFTATTLADFGDITVMEVEGDYDADVPESYTARQEIAKEFFKSHPDDYDFFIIFSNFDFRMPQAEAKGFYQGVKNDVLGIGKEPFDNTSFYGSEGKLQGTIDMGNINTVVADPLDPGFEETMTILSHELLHRWAAFVKFKQADGTPNESLLGIDGSHWSFLLDTAGSVQYGNRWQDNGDGTFTALAGFKYYSPLDLYLMGFLDKSEVAPMLLIEDTPVDPARLPEAGITITGTGRTITIEDIIAAEGERTPPAAESQKDFKFAFT